MGPIIAAIGKPAIVEAEIPIAWCGGDRGLRLAMNMPKIIKQHLPGQFIGQVHVHPSPEFMRLLQLERRVIIMIPHRGPW
ncbi:hypothetical protein FJ930_27955 [Mesorhizobium sp. B2-4-15]|uniref:hypothetical protein n=1 Tax=unclassified Mesorhizobium TaxID=325217 RepID=UPI0011263BF9|nr:MULTISPECIES: hypothetical protein [unclassified Mesorhizobium]TPK61166.1 hypothetical protein FJ930_27955 [Mesorhizobium sp. B2-4-15]TPM12639.1 hypothetical protein FJ958_31280 [Mesorhizobium sp. B2-3-5]